jgi:hypothetical protein
MKNLPKKLSLIVTIFLFVGCNQVDQNSIVGVDDTSSNISFDQEDPALIMKNVQTRRDLGVDQLNSYPYNLNGKGLAVGVVDRGAILGTHQEFSWSNGSGSRIIKKTDVAFNSHSTHIAGTIGARGVDENARGIAKDVQIYSYAYSESFFSYAMNKMFEDDGILISNHSYGYTTKTALGEYDTFAILFDEGVSANPYLHAVVSAGNDGGKIDYPEYGTIKGASNAKNIITIGALDSDSDDVTSFSSIGPVKDGRIKPDFVARGSLVYSPSASSNDSYKYMSGTSMATPAVTGLVVLMEEAYRNIKYADIRVDTTKAILANTATDVGNSGPDYRSGFGMVNAKKAVDVIRTMGGSHSLVKLSSIKQSELKEYKFYSDGNKDFKATISWVDIAGNNSSHSLVNDLDIYIKDKYNNIYYPFTLNKNSPNREAKKNKFNRVDNIEQVHFNLPRGSYKLIVKGYKVEGIQKFTLVSNKLLK